MSTSYLIALIEYCDVLGNLRPIADSIPSYLIALIEYCDLKTKHTKSNEWSESKKNSYLIALIEYCDLIRELIRLRSYTSVLLI